MVFVQFGGPRGDATQAAVGRRAWIRRRRRVDARRRRSAQHVRRRRVSVERIRVGDAPLLTTAANAAATAVGRRAQRRRAVGCRRLAAQRSARDRHVTLHTLLHLSAGKTAHKYDAARLDLVFASGALVIRLQGSKRPSERASERR